MESIIDKLWDKNLAAADENLCMTEEMKSMLIRLDAIRQKLVSTLTDDQYEALREFEECYDSVAALSEREVYAHAFRLGAKMGLEIAGKETK